MSTRLVAARWLLALTGGILACGEDPEPTARDAAAPRDALPLFDGAMDATVEPDASTSGPVPTRTSVRLFVSGHSLVDNPMTDFVLVIAESLGTDAAYEQQIVIGSPLRVRTKGNDPNVADWPGYRLGKNRTGGSIDVVAELASPRALPTGARYDTLLVTERNDPLETLRYEATLRYLRDYRERFLSANAEGRTFLFHAWQPLDRSAPQPFVAYERDSLAVWECTADASNRQLASSGRAERMRVVPAGAALATLLELSLAGRVTGLGGGTAAVVGALFSDNVHPTRLGAYYVALVTYATLFGRSPVGAAVPDGVDSNVGRALQPIAWSVVEPHLRAERSRSPAECRAATVATCERFYARRNEPFKVAGCRDFYGSATDPNNPFRDP